MHKAENPGFVLLYIIVILKSVSYFLSSWPTGSVWSFFYTKRFIWLFTLSALIYTFTCTYSLTSALRCVFFHEMLSYDFCFFFTLWKHTWWLLTFLGFTCYSAGYCSQSEVLVLFFFFLCVVIIDCQVLFLKLKALKCQGSYNLFLKYYFCIWMSHAKFYMKHYEFALYALISIFSYMQESYAFNKRMVIEIMKCTNTYNLTLTGHFCTIRCLYFHVS